MEMVGSSYHRPDIAVSSSSRPLISLKGFQGQHLMHDASIYKSAQWTLIQGIKSVNKPLLYAEWILV